MDAKELRIGNLVSRLDLGDHSLRVESVLELRKDKVLTTGPISVICLYSETKPIPLTEEWLLKFGFERIDGMWTISNFNGYLTKYLLLNGENGYKYFVSHCGMLNVRFVHQLQNLYFDLTGEELNPL